MSVRLLTSELQVRPEVSGNREWVTVRPKPGSSPVPVTLVGRVEVGADQIRMGLPSVRIQTNILTCREIKKCFKQSRFCPVKFRLKFLPFCLGCVPHRS